MAVQLVGDGASNSLLLSLDGHYRSIGEGSPLN